MADEARQNHRARLFAAIGRLDNPPARVNGEFGYAMRVYECDPAKPGKSRIVAVQVPDIATERPLEPGLYLVRQVVEQQRQKGKPLTRNGRYQLVICKPDGSLEPIWAWIANDTPMTQGRTLCEGQFPSDKADLNFIRGALATVNAAWYPNENIPTHFKYADATDRNVPKDLVARQRQLMQEPAAVSVGF